jgi:hypothetical protein
MNSKAKIHCARIEDAGLLALAGALLLLAPANSVEAQFIYSINNGAITITSNTGAGGAVTIPSTLDGLPVTSIGSNAFQNQSNLTSITLPDSLINIGDSAFADCVNLADATIGKEVTMIGEFPIGSPSGLGGFTIPSSVVSLGNDQFGFSALTNVTVPGAVTNIGGDEFYICFARTGGNGAGGAITIGAGAFTACVRLTGVDFHKSVAGIGDGAFYFCTSLKAVHFVGDAPGIGRNAFASDAATIYFLHGAAGWDATFGGLPTAEWTPPSPVILTSGPGVGAQNNGFGFSIVGANKASVVVETTSLTNLPWMPLATNTLSGGASYFSDTNWTDDEIHFYRLAAP